MQKQTVEQAASRFINKYLNGRVDTSRACDIEESFLAGAAWQAQQGIEWVSLTSDNWPEVGKYVIVALEIGVWLKARVLYKEDGILNKVWSAFYADGEHEVRNSTVTHYAFINLPKSDNDENS